MKKAMTLESRRDYVLRCDRCSGCKWVPGMPSERFASACPSIEFGKFHSYSGSGKSITAYAVMEGRIHGYSAELLRSVYACSACGACDTGCKWHHADAIDPLDTIYALRAKIVADGAALPAHKEAIEALRREGNRYGKPAAERSRWAAGLALADIIAKPAPVLLHIGSENAYEPSQWPELRNIVALLKRAGVEFGVLADAEPDDGGYAFDIGFQEEATRLAQRTAALIAQSQAQLVVTCSAAAYWAFRNVYPRLGVKLGIKIEHVAQTVERLLADATIPLPAGRRPETVSYHDSCKLGRLAEPYPEWSGRWVKAMNQINATAPSRPVPFGNDGVYDAPRRLIDRVAAARVELQRNRQFAYCCGALGGGKEAYPDFARHAARERLEEVRASGASAVVSACGACTAHLREVARQTDAGVRVIGLFEYLAQEAPASPERTA